MEIVLSEEEISILNRIKYSGEFYPSRELKEKICDIINKACEYLETYCNGEDPEDVLIWYYDKYLEQQKG